MNGEILRLVDVIHKDRSIDKEIVFQGIELALLSAARKHFGLDEDITIEIDRETGELVVSGDRSNWEELPRKPPSRLSSRRSGKRNAMRSTMSSFSAWRPL